MNSVVTYSVKESSNLADDTRPRSALCVVPHPVWPAWWHLPSPLLNPFNIIQPIELCTGEVLDVSFELVRPWLLLDYVRSMANTCCKLYNRAL